MVKSIKKLRHKDKQINIRLIPRRTKLIHLVQLRTGIYNYAKLFDRALIALLKHATIQKEKKQELESLDLSDIDKLYNDIESEIEITE